MTTRIAGLLLTVALGLSSVQADDRAVFFILDGSNSMWGRIDGTEKIVVARDVLGEVLSSLPPDIQLGLAAYGHRRKDACDDIETILPLGVHPQADLEAAIRSVQPTGMTPITAALEHVAEALGNRSGSSQIVLVSDGKETCGRDPCAAIGTLRDAGIDLTVHVVGFDVTDEESEQLRCIARESGGRYAGAGTADELILALADIQESVVEEAAIAPPAGETEGPYWRLESDGEIIEGRLFRYFRLDGKPMIQLVNRDAVNFAMVFEGDMRGEKTVSEAMFGHGRGPICGRVGPLDLFTIQFQPSDPGWVTGTFSGALGCPDYRLMEVTGLFRLPAPGAQP